MRKLLLPILLFSLRIKRELFELCETAIDKELKWHLALLLSRLPLNTSDFNYICSTLTQWAADTANSRIVRVNAVQSLFELVQQHAGGKEDFKKLLQQLEKENIPSLNARIRKLLKKEF